MVPPRPRRQRDSAQSATATRRCSRTLDLPERFVVYPANLWPHKNHERLVDALAVQRERDVDLVLTGQPWNRLDAAHGARRASWA